MTRRTLYVLLIGVALFCLSLTAGCGRKPTEPKADPCIKVDTLWRDGQAVLWLKTYYSTCPTPRKP